MRDGRIGATADEATSLGISWPEVSVKSNGRRNVCQMRGSEDGVGDSPQLSEKEIGYSENLYLLAQARQLRWFDRFRHCREIPRAVGPP